MCYSPLFAAGIMCTWLPIKLFHPSQDKHMLHQFLLQRAR
jgi:hypothetical protein